MSKCAKCGQECSFWSRDLFTGVCTKCQSASTHPVSLGCGSLILIAMIVLFFGRSGSGDVLGHLSKLQVTTSELKKANEEQTKELQELKRAVEELHKALARKDK